MRLAGSDKNCLSGPDRSGRSPNANPALPSQTNDQHRTSSPSFPLDPMRYCIWKKSGSRDVEVSQNGMPPGGFLNGAGQYH